MTCAKSQVHARAAMGSNPNPNPNPNPSPSPSPNPNPNLREEPGAREGRERLAGRVRWRGEPLQQGPARVACDGGEYAGSAEEVGEG